jgi:hypothetical protein
MDNVLVVIPCGRMKIWDKHPHRGPTPARHAFTSPYFEANRAYAERFGNRWVILSDKYGFIDPDYVIPGPYDVTFNDPRTNPICVDALRAQVGERGLRRFANVIALGGRDHRKMIMQAFEADGASVYCPVAGLGIEEQKRMVREAIRTGKPLGRLS